MLWKVEERKEMELGVGRKEMRGMLGREEEKKGVACN